MKQYETYKDSGIEWLGMIPGHWLCLRVKDFGKTRSGDGLTLTEQSSDGVYEVWGGNGFVGYHNSYNENGNSIIIGRVGALCGNVRLCKFPIFVTDNALILTVNQDISISFLYYSLRARDLNKLNESNAQPLITGTKVLNTFVPIPPFTEQERIVEYLDAKCGDIDNRIAVLEKEQKAYERLKVAVINRAVTEGLDPETPKRDSGLDWLGMIPEHWEVMRLKDVSELNPRYVGKDIRDDVDFLPMEGLRHDIITTQQIDFEEGRKKYTHFENGDLLIAKVTPCFENWNIAIATELRYGVGFGSSEFFVLRTNDKCLNRFLFYLVCVEPFQGKACETMCGVGGLKRISPLFMRTQRIGLPPLSEQQVIVEYLDTKCATIDAKIGNIAKRIEAYKRLKRALINEVVTGKRAV